MFILGIANTLLSFKFFLLDIHLFLHFGFIVTVLPQPHTCSQGAKTQFWGIVVTSCYFWLPDVFWYFKPSSIIIQKATFSNECTSLIKCELHIRLQNEYSPVQWSVLIHGPDLEWFIFLLDVDRTTFFSRYFLRIRRGHVFSLN